MYLLGRGESVCGSGYDGEDVSQDSGLDIWLDSDTIKKAGLGKLRLEFG